MIGDYFSKMATAEKMSPQQLNQSVKDGVLTQDMAQNVMPTPAQPGIQGLQQPPIAQQVMQQADQMIAPEQIKQKINELKDVIAQVYQGVQSGEIEAYKGIPYIKEQLDKIQELQVQLPKQGIDTAPQLAQAAPQEAPQQAPQGIDTAPSNLPTQMASGGIVAFADNKNQPVSANMPSGPTDYSDYVAPTDYDPVSQYRAARDLATRESLRNKYGVSSQDFYGTNVAPIKSPYDAALGYYANRLNPESPQASPEYPAFLELKSRRDAWMQGKPDPYSQTSPVGSVPNMLGTQEPAVVPPKAPATSSEANKNKIIIHDDKQPIAKATTDTQPDAMDKTLADYESAIKNVPSDREGLKQLILGDDAERAKDSKRDMWLEALKASFKLMGGTSPYAAANLGAAGESLATGISGVLSRQDEEKQKRIGQLVALGLKGSELDTELAKLGLTKAEYEAKLPVYKAQAWKYMHPTSAAGAPKGINSNVADQIMDRYSAYGQSYKTAKTAPFYNDNISIPQMNDKPLEWTQKDRLFLEDNPDSPGGQKALEKWKQIVKHKQDERLGKLYLLGGSNTAQSALTSDE